MANSTNGFPSVPWIQLAPTSTRPPSRVDWWTRPPMRDLASNMVTSNPSAASSPAALRPLIPAPTTQTRRFAASSCFDMELLDGHLAGQNTRTYELRILFFRAYFLRGNGSDQRSCSACWCHEQNRACNPERSYRPQHAPPPKPPYIVVPRVFTVSAGPRLGWRHFFGCIYERMGIYSELVSVSCITALIPRVSCSFNTLESRVDFTPALDQSTLPVYIPGDA